MGRPPGFSAGDRWTIPLQPTPPGSPLVAEVYLLGRGPYRFFLSPDSDASSISLAVAKELGLYLEKVDLRVLDSRDVGKTIPYLAEVPKLSIGDLTVKARKFVVHDHGGIIAGTIGRDVLDDTLIWDLRQAAGTLTLATQGHQPLPANAHRVELEPVGSHFHARVIVNGKPATLVVAFGPEMGSFLHPRLAATAGLRESRRGIWSADAVTLGDLVLRDVAFGRYRGARDDRRDGILGGATLQHFDVIVNMHRNVMWLVPRGPAPATVSSHGGSP